MKRHGEGEAIQSHKHLTCYDSHPEHWQSTTVSGYASNIYNYLHVNTTVLFISFYHEHKQNTHLGQREYYFVRHTM